MLVFWVWISIKGFWQYVYKEHIRKFLGWHNEGENIISSYFLASTPMVGVTVVRFSSVKGDFSCRNLL